MKKRASRAIGYITFGAITGSRREAPAWRIERRREKARAGSFCRIQKGGVIDVTAPLPDHMEKSWELFGFDVKLHDPIEDAPDA